MQKEELLVIISSTLALMVVGAILLGNPAGLDDSKNISDLIKGKDPHQRSVIVATALAERMPVTTFQYAYTYNTSKGQKTDIYIVQLKKITADKTNGLLNVWMNATRNGIPLAVKNPVSFYNPPFQIGSGTNKKENPITATRQSIIRILRNTPEGKPEFGGVDPTVVIYHSDSGFLIKYNSSTLTWAEIHTNGGVSAGDTTECNPQIEYCGQQIRIDEYSGGPPYSYTGISRGALLFNTSILQDVTITSAQLPIVLPPYSAYFELGSMNLSLTQTNRTVSNANYEFQPNFWNATGAGTKVASDFWIDDEVDYHTYGFTASGISYINKTGTTTFMLRLDADVNNTAPDAGPAFEDSSSYTTNFATEGEPYLQIEYTGTLLPSLPPVIDYTLTTPYSGFEGHAIYINLDERIITELPGNLYNFSYLDWGDGDVTTCDVTDPLDPSDYFVCMNDMRSKAHSYTTAGTFTISVCAGLNGAVACQNTSGIGPIFPDPGWLPPWTDRKLHIIEGSQVANDSTLADYQYKIRIWNRTGTDSGSNVYLTNMSSKNWNDMRITTGDGNTTLKFGIYNTTEWFADVGVKLPRANNMTEIFIYANNSAASTASDPLNTFDFYEDCNEATINTTKWFVVDNVTANSPTAGWCDIMSNSSAADSLTSRNPPWPIPRPGIFEFRGRSYHVSTAVGERIFHYQTDYARNWASIFALSAKLAYTSYNGTTTNTTKMKGWNAKSDNILEMQYDPIHRTSRWYINGTLDNDNVMKEPWGSIPTALNISFATYTNTAEIAIDWVLVRKYANQTPAGYETRPLEVNISGAPPVSTPVAAFACIPLITPRNGTVTCTDASTNTPTAWDWYSPPQYAGGPTLFSGNLTQQNPVIFPMQWGYGELCLIATNAGGSDTECKGNYIYVRQP